MYIWYLLFYILSTYRQRAAQTKSPEFIPPLLFPEQEQFESGEGCADMVTVNALSVVDIILTINLSNLLGSTLLKVQAVRKVAALINTSGIRLDLIKR